MDREIYVLGVSNFYDLKSNSWAGAIQTLEAIEEKGLEDELIDHINDLIDLMGGKIDETQLNDYLWFDTESIEEALDCKLWND